MRRQLIGIRSRKKLGLSSHDYKIIARKYAIYGIEVAKQSVEIVKDKLEYSVQKKVPT